MTAPEDRPDFSLLPPDAPKEDRIGTAFLAMGSAAAAAVAWFSGLTLIQTRLVVGSTARTITQINPNSPDVNFMVYGTVLGLGFTGVSAWLLMAAIPSTYRRGALAMVAALAGTSLAMVATLVLYQFTGRPALIALGIVSVTIALWLGRRAILSSR
jgi:Co/Zn/Cd efflux system component